MKSFSWIIFPQAPSGTLASLPRFNVTSFWIILGFHLPLNGWSPLPMKRPGGSAIQLATSTCFPSIIAIPYLAFIFSLISFRWIAIFFFWSLSSINLESFSLSTTLFASEKSISESEMLLYFGGRTFTKSSRKFLQKTLSWTYGVSFFFAHW